MDELDRASEAEEKQRESALYLASKPVNSRISEKRRHVAEAREIAAQRGLDDPDLDGVSHTCENCEEPLALLETDDIFCSADCAIDWRRRELVRTKTNAR